jgi:peptide/nickel transport system permease protein
MLPFLARRVGHALLVVLLVCTATFAIVHGAPGGPSLLADPKLTREEQAAIERRLGIDRPLTVQYARWVGRLATGDLGNSFLYQTPNVETIGARIPNTLLLAGSALLLSVLVAVPLGILSASHPRGWLDRLTSALSVGAMSVPVFWLGIVLILLFAVRWQILPAGGVASDGAGASVADRVRHLVLPTIVLAAAGTAELLRYARSGARAVLDQVFIRAARAKGLRPSTVRWKHVARNALLTVVTAIGLQLPRLIGGAAITETVFSWPGMGRLGVEAALARDYPLVMAVTLLVSLGVVTASLLVDVAYVLLDPRIRRQ